MHAKSQCIPSSRDMSSLDVASPGISPRFFNQKIAQNDPEKKIPSTAAKATSRSAKLAYFALVHRSAHSAFFLTTGAACFIGWSSSLSLESDDDESLSESFAGLATTGCFLRTTATAGAAVPSSLELSLELELEESLRKMKHRKRTVSMNAL